MLRADLHQRADRAAVHGVGHASAAGTKNI